MVIAQRTLQQSSLVKRYLLFDSSLLPEVDDSFFSPEHWRRQGALVDQASGRGDTYAFCHGQERFFLRHYRRGGLVETLCKDFYLWTGLRSTRAWREVHLLRTMRDSGLPVPRPAAARIVRYGAVYRADLITQCIFNAATLSSLIAKKNLTEESWYTIGACIRRFHLQGVFHADLNAQNILIDAQGKVWLIDFDKGSLCTLNARQKQANLNRLKKSLDKIRPENTPPTAKSFGWSLLLQGYNDGGSTSSLLNRHNA